MSDGFLGALNVKYTATKFVDNWIEVIMFGVARCSCHKVTEWTQGGWAFYPLSGFVIYHISIIYEDSICWSVGDGHRPWKASVFVLASRLYEMQRMCCC